MSKTEETGIRKEFRELKLAGPTEPTVLHHTFKLIAGSKKDYITREALKNFLQVLEEEPTEKEVTEMMERITNGFSDKISYDQFYNFMQQSDKQNLFKYGTFNKKAEVKLTREDFKRPHKSLSMDRKLTKKEQEREKLKEAFEIFDFNENDRISIKDIINLMTMMDISIEKDEVEVLFSLVKKHKHIDFHQFVELYYGWDNKYAA
mmetsp:Transcript_9353/g.13846  ORF Transcript_9353/g.13846 Transcript_9353/m.13846 type:complete len:205 (+) Transcript_9353:75-689(+)